MTTSLQRLSWWVLALAVAAAVLATLAPRQGDAAEATATASAAKTVQIKNFAFKPATMEVNRGARVAFSNASGVPHTATSRSFDTKRIAPGKSVTVRFSKRGTFSYHCKIHPYMKGKVVVD